MSTINTNVSSLIAQRALAQNNLSLQTSLTRLSTGLKINSGADDPAGLIAANALKDQQSGITQAIANANRANNVIGTAEGGLTEVSSLLTQLQSLVSQTANSGGLSSDEVSANQQQVDSILSTINRISGSTQFAGKQLLNGNYAYTTSSAATSAFAAIQINAALLADNTTKAVVVTVTSAATYGQLKHSEATSSLAAAQSLQVGGITGTQQLSFAAGTKLSAVVASVNGIKTDTGVSAIVSTDNKTIRFDATATGSQNYVTVTSTTGTTFSTVSGAAKAAGTDAKVTVNGAAAQVSGTVASYRDNTLDLQFTLSAGLNTTGTTKTFGITGGGATFAFGDKVNERRQGVDRHRVGLDRQPRRRDQRVPQLPVQRRGQQPDQRQPRPRPRASSTRPSTRSRPSPAASGRSRSTRSGRRSTT